jgi:hypothetical protein
VSTTVIYDKRFLPRATVTQEDDGSYTAIIDGVAGLAPDRTPSSEEIADGISSLDPVTVTALTPRDLVDRCQLGLSAAVRATPGATEGVKAALDMLWARVRAAIAVKGALDMFGGDAGGTAVDI